MSTHRDPVSDPKRRLRSPHGRRRPAGDADPDAQGSTRIAPSPLAWEQSVTTSQPSQPFSGRTTWIRRFQTPLREFLRTEAGGALILLSAAIAALVWVNVDASSYDAFWGTTLSVDLGELRERRRFALPLLAGIGGMATAIAIYLAFNMGGSSALGWGIAMSTDTAFALGLLALVGRRLPDRLRVFILTVVVVDDILALVVIATVYTEQVKVSALLAALGVFGAVLVVRALGVRQALVYALLGAATGVALLESGVEPVVLGLAMGLLTYAYPAARSELERSARNELRSVISANERLQLLYHPWTSYVIVPLFALANAGIAIDGGFLERAFSSPITLGILFGYVVGKPVGILGTSWLVARLSRQRLRPPVGWAAVAGGGTIAGIGFTVSLLVATLAFDGPQLEEAKLGILSAALCASIITWLLFRATALLPRHAQMHALLGTDEPLVDLYIEVDPERDHIRGPLEAPVTVVEYGDFECPYCGQAEPFVRELLRDFGDVRYVWRHLPLNDVHPQAQLAAEAAEAAAAQDAFWPMHDLLLDHQDALLPADLIRYAEQLGLDIERFSSQLRKHAGANRVAEDVNSADLSGVSGTPTFFINGRRHYGAYDTATLSAAVRVAKARETVAAS